MNPEARIIVTRLRRDLERLEKLLAAEDPAPRVLELERATHEPKYREVADLATVTFNASSLVRDNGGRLGSVVACSDKRRRAILRATEAARPFSQSAYGTHLVGEKFWQDYWLAVDADDFASGRQGGGKGHENWRPDFDYLIRPDVMARVLERAANLERADG